jgi:predicted component of type VI protein secretion system
MGVLQEFERRLEGAVEGFFARAFRSGIQPIELAKAVQRYAGDHQHVTADGVVVPNVYRLTVGPKDHDRLEGFGASLPRELAEVLVSTAAERGWILRGPAKIRIAVDDEVKLGRFRITGRIEVVEGPAAASRPSSASSAPSPLGGAPNPARASGVPGSFDARARPSPAPVQPVAPAQPVTPVASSSPSGFDHTQVVATVPGAGLHLVVRRAQGSNGVSVPVQGSRLTAGRLERCDLTIQDSTVSREHAAFVRRGERWWVVDLGSTNGTRVNGRRAAEHPLEPGDQVELGDALVELVGG